MEQLTPRSHTLLPRAAQLFAFWTAVAVLFALQWYSYDLIHGNPHHLLQALRWSMEQWYPWLILSPAVLWLAAKYPIDPQRPFRWFLLHLTASLIGALSVICMQVFMSYLVEPAMGSLRIYFTFVLGKDSAIDISTYWAITALAQMLHFYREISNRQLRETELERQLAQAQLEVVQMQLHPHFLFNTLHAIGTLIREEPGAAEKMLLDLGSLLRIFLEQNPSRQISLRRELSLVDHYLGIQRVRFRDRLTVESRVAPETLDALVPSLILQPIVENAIVHGVAKNPGCDLIEISSWHHRDELHIEISNSNSVLPEEAGGQGTGWGIGLSNTEQRLAQIYNGSAKLSLRAQSPRGVVCRVTMPLTKSTAESEETEALLSL